MKPISKDLVPGVVGLLRVLAMKTLVIRIMYGHLGLFRVI